jgi:hypothetical protein
MIFYLNPFTWGMRRVPRYYPSHKTSELLMQLNKKYNMDIDVGETVDSLWYFRDLKHHRISKLENFNMSLMDNDTISTDIKKVESYINDFKSKFEHRKYFDSIVVSVGYDSVIYKSKMK